MSYILAYIPVIHQGYITFLQKHYHVGCPILLLSDALVDEYKFLEREIRALDSKTTQRLLRALGFLQTEILTHNDFSILSGKHFTLPDEGITRRFAGDHLQDCTVEFDRTFLRWDETYVSSQDPVTFDRISEDPQDRAYMDLARTEGEKSSDWWRRVGAIVPLTSASDFSVSDFDLAAHNTHMPSEYSPYAYGDIRDFIPAGQNNDVCSAIHAEKAIICEAARRGIPLQGKHIYTSVFPCPDCARWIARTGIKKCFYGSGHASLDGEKNLKAYGVEIIYVK